MHAVLCPISFIISMLLVVAWAGRVIKDKFRLKASPKGDEYCSITVSGNSPLAGVPRDVSLRVFTNGFRVYCLTGRTKGMTKVGDKRTAVLVGSILTLWDMTVALLCNPMPCGHSSVFGPE
jgi:hypothetical protein